ncbi:MAG: hypothetical protein LBI28_02270 [Treponema sp.]|jgi:hypothetical protein|nr:hypothetical protein [Treponema sp.]
MVSFLKKTVNSRRLITGAVLILCVLFTACDDLQMGLGDPVDTVNPDIRILKPIDEEMFPSITLGRAIELSGIWTDNVGVTKLRFEVWTTDTHPRLVDASITSYTINPDGTWVAYLVINEIGDLFYNIKVYAYDKFGNDNLDVKMIKADIVPPWVEKANIIRHPNYEHGIFKGFESTLHDLDYYYEIGFDTYEAYRSIKWENIDDYQNETFTVNLEIKSEFAVGASRLNIYDSFGELINNDGPIKPSNNIADRRNPTWDITASQLATWRPDLLGLSGRGRAHYIRFEILAWNSGQNSWNGDEQTGQPAPDANVRIEDVGGTCWYIDSDSPHIYFDTKDMVSNMLILQVGSPSALLMDFYDDDRLGNVYYGLVKKEAFDTLRSNAGMSGGSEDAYLQSLIAPSSTTLSAALNAIGNTSKYNGTERFQDFPLSTVGLDTGEYRLIALVQDGKPAGQGFSFPPSPQINWSVYPSIRIQVQDQNSPLVIIEKPERENVFPSLAEGDGESFVISGYTLDRNGVDSIHIAWVTPRTAPASPDAPAGTAGTATGLSTSSGETAIKTIKDDELNPLPQGENKIMSNGIKVWNLELGEPIEMMLNGVPYKRTDFSCTFHILDDFKYARSPTIGAGDALVNDEKLFVIVADNGNPITKTFRLDGTTQGPQIDITWPVSRHSYHDVAEDLDLSMMVTRGNSGVALVTNSQLIYNKDDGKANGVSFVGPTTQNQSSRAWERTVSSDYIKNNYIEGSLKVYGFEARNILGLTTEIERTITMSNRPVLESISCTNGTGTYGIGKTLTFEVAFSMSIRIPVAYEDRLPRLRLYKTNPGTGQPAVSFYAEMPKDGTGKVIDQNGGTILRFVYEIKENDDTALLYTALNPLDNAGSIFSYQNSEALSIFENHTNSLQNKTPITIDATRPSILRASFVQLDGFTGTSYFNNGKTLTLKLYASEQVQVSGAPRVSVFASTNNTNRVELSFSRVVQEAGRYVIYFTKVLSEPTTIDNQQVIWASYNGVWITANGGSISDAVGNQIINYTGLGGSLSEANRTGAAATVSYPDGNVNYTAQQARIKTTTPPAPTVGFFTVATGGTAIATGLTGDPVIYNNTVYLNVTGTETNLRYSTTGGTNPQVVSGRATLSDTDRNNRNLDTYKPSTSMITAWQVDLAGNSSNIPQPRQVIINSRAPELQGVDVSLPDGWYPRGTAMTFKFYFSDVLKGANNTNINNPTNSPARATFTITGTEGTFNGTATITNTLAYTESASSTMLCVNWTVPQTGLTVPMRNIKLSAISFTGVTDEYGNDLVAYTGTATPTDTRRPITNASSFNMARPEFGIRPAGPVLTGTTPARPAGQNVNYNGGLLAEGVNSITLTFDTAVNPVPGKYITIRPYGTWAIPPILTTDEFDALYNYSFESGVKEQYQRWLKNADGNELPLRDQGRGRDRTENFYIKNTHGLTTGTQGNARPNTTTKMVLNFNTGLIEGRTATETQNIANLRTVFNAAKWKWQEIHVPSVTLNANRTTVTVPITDLQKGRIWEVLVEDGAFTDDAGNSFVGGVAAGDFRFWSGGTENPVVRVEKISYDGNNGIQENVDRGFVSTAGVQSIPPIDTMVRIDCETPGATIYYDTVRTRINFAGTTPLNPFTSTVNVRADFFGTGEGLNLSTLANTGYQNNDIGNDDVGVTANRDNESFFSRLLVPNNRQSASTQAPAHTLSNGVFSMNVLTTLGQNLGGNNFGGTGRGRQWGSSAINGQNGSIYIGDAWDTTSNTAANNTATTLFTGRRDYIVAVARKNEVTTTGSYARGPQLTVSVAPESTNGYAGMEGVYKTTLIYRQPRFQTAGTNVARLLVQGFDLPVIPVVAGFPLRDADINSPNDSAINNYFSKTAYRLNGTTADLAYDNANNCYIWITWEIVTDWYQKGKLIRGTGAGNYLFNTNDQWNQNSVAAPYGGIIYRYQQQFYNP